MVERVIIALVVIGLGTGAWIALNRLTLLRVAARSNTDPLLADLRPNTPTVVYFTTPLCVPCRTQQQPALRQLQAELGENIQVIQVDASEQPEIADRWGVFSAPTTFVLDRALKPRHVNRGVMTADALKQQIEHLSS